VISFADAQVFLPKYLSPEGRKELFSEIKKFEGVSYYCKVDDPEPIQGDGWSEVEFIDLELVERRSIRAIVLSNSCDISVDNRRKMPARITISPLIRLSRLVNLLKKYAVPEQQIDQYLQDVRKQEVSNVFFLPAGAGLEEDSVAFFDSAQAPLLLSFTKSPDKTRLFTLSQFAFWLLLVKIAIHFCRAQEDILRSSSLPA